MVRHVAWMRVVLAATSAAPPRAPGDTEEVARLYKENRAERTPPGRYRPCEAVGTLGQGGRHLQNFRLCPVSKG
jgi:hypothetical protein